MKVYRMVEDAKLPVKNDGDRAYDLFSIEEKEVKFGEVVKVRTGIKIEFPEGYHAILKGRSGLAANHGINILGGVVDSHYRGEVIVILTKAKSEKDSSLFESTEVPYVIKKGEKIVQMKLEKDVTFEIEEVYNEEELTTTSRNEKGFGSSGNT